ncbi:MAG: FHA domain-containing protein [Chloroflexi bacterium]|nr:FHA domain-containing protein [Chloroflexota bacterium]
MQEETGRLVVTSPGSGERLFGLKGTSLVTIGRHPANVIVVQDARSSRNHIRLDWDGSAWTLSDLG